MRMARRGKVDQIGIVRHDHANAGRRPRGLELLDFLVLQGFRVPLARVFCENLHRRAADVRRKRKRLMQPAADGNMCANQ